MYYINYHNNYLYKKHLLLTIIVFLYLNVVAVVARNSNNEWEGIERFEKFGYDVLPCPTYQRSQCCICKAIVSQLENLIKNPDATRNYEVDAYGFRMNERHTNNRKKKKRVPYVESMAGIAEALDNVCYSNLSMSIPKIETRVEKATDLYFFTCDDFAKDFEEFVQKRFFDYSNNIGNNFVYEICVEDTKLCDGLNKTYSNAPYWPITLSELNSLSKDLKDAYTILEEIVSLNKTIDETRKKTKGRKNYINDNNSMSPKRIEQKLLINKLFFKLGHAAALSRSSNQQLWYTLFTQNIVMEEYEIAKIKLINKIHAANSFHDDDLFDEEEEEED